MALRRRAARVCVCVCVIKFAKAAYGSGWTKPGKSEAAKRGDRERKRAKSEAARTARGALRGSW